VAGRHDLTRGDGLVEETGHARPLVAPRIRGCDLDGLEEPGGDEDESRRGEDGDGAPAPGAVQGDQARQESQAEETGGRVPELELRQEGHPAELQRQPPRRGDCRDADHVSAHAGGGDHPGCGSRTQRFGKHAGAEPGRPRQEGIHVAWLGARVQKEEEEPDGEGEEGHASELLAQELAPRVASNEGREHEGAARQEAGQGPGDEGPALPEVGAEGEGAADQLLAPAGACEVPGHLLEERDEPGSEDDQGDGEDDRAALQCDPPPEGSGEPDPEQARTQEDPGRWAFRERGQSHEDSGDEEQAASLGGQVGCEGAGEGEEGEGGLDLSERSLLERQGCEEKEQGREQPQVPRSAAPEEQEQQGDSQGRQECGDAGYGGFDPLARGGGVRGAEPRAPRDQPEHARRFGQVDALEDARDEVVARAQHGACREGAARFFVDELPLPESG